MTRAEFKAPDTSLLIFSIILGFTDPEAAPIIAFVLLIGGAFAVLQRTRAVDDALRRLVRRSRESRLLELMLLPMFMTLFSLGGAIFGMAEETIPFVLIFVPLALALGYDSITGAAIPFVGSAAGFAAAFFFLGIAALVWGVLPAARGGFGWYIVEIAALFVALGAVMGAVGGLGANGTAGAFMDGVRQLASTAVIIGLARGILVVLQDGQVIDTVLHAMATALENTSAAGAAMAMFGVQTAINFFIVSGSGQAALTMPLMAPLSDLVGVTRQTAVLAYQMGDGFTNMIIPTNAVLMGVLTLADVPWMQWAKWILPLQILLFALGLVALFVAVSIGYGT